MTIRSTSLVAPSSRRAIEPYTKAQIILLSKDRSATLSVGISPTVFSNMLRSSRKIGDRVSALKYVLRPSLRCCNMPLCSSEISSRCRLDGRVCRNRSEEHTSELQSRLHLVCRLLLEKKKTNTPTNIHAYST